jgi:competence protein ComGC
MRRKTHCGKAHRASFTLVELLVVIAIIAALMALVVSATVRYLQTQAQKNTEATISKVDSVLRVHWRYVIDQAKSGGSMPDVITNNIVGSVENDANRARVIYTKLKLKQQFPMSYYEALNNPLGADPAFVRELGSAGIGYSAGQTAPSWPPGPEEFSVCLLISLKQARGGINLNPDDLGPDVVKPSSSAKGLQKMVDFWGTPLAFFRWPTLDGEIDGTGPAANVIKRDVQDGDGTLIDPNWWIQQNLRLQFEAQCHLVSTPVVPPQPAPPIYTYNPATRAAIKAYYMVPVIVSAGPDKKFGIAAPSAPVIYDPNNPPNLIPAPPPWPDPMQVNSADANDNIYSHRLRVGGRGD